LLQVAKALRLLAKKRSIVTLKNKNKKIKLTSIVSQEFLTPLEETRLAIEEIVIINKVPVDLFPRTSRIRKQQHELVAHYQLKGVSVGEEKNRRIRILPK